MFDKNLHINSARKSFLTSKKLSLGFGILVVVMISYYLITQIFDAFKSSDRLTDAVSKVHSLEIKNKELKQQLKEVTSLEFIEKEARDKLGLAKEGETLVIIPDQALEKVLGLNQETTIEPRLPNWKGWLKLFFN